MRSSDATLDSSFPSQVDAIRHHILSDAPYRVDAVAPPQRIRLGGFSAVFERYCNQLANAECTFGSVSVRCECDQSAGTLQCDVPHAPPSPSSTLSLVAKIDDFQTPPLQLKTSTVVVHAQQSLTDAIASPPPTPPPPRAPHLRLIDRFFSRRKVSLLHQCIAECIGTMLIVVFGVGSVCAAVLTEAQTGLWQIAVVWGFGVALAILATNSVSGSHLNPAVSLAFAIFRPHAFPSSKLLPYWLAQYAGGILGGALNLLIFGPAFANFEAVNQIERGSPRSVLTARAFGEYFPDPGNDLLSTMSVNPAFALMVEAWGTAILMFVILALTDHRHKLIKAQEMVPFYIGFTVSVLISLYAPLTQAGWNPARDFGPRIVAALAGWRSVAIPGPKNGFWIYIIGPKIGAPIGAFLYDLLIDPGLSKHATASS